MFRIKNYIGRLGQWVVWCRVLRCFGVPYGVAFLRDYWGQKGAEMAHFPPIGLPLYGPQAESGILGRKKFFFASDKKSGGTSIAR